MSSLLTALASVPDSRSGHGRRYKLHHLLFACILARMSGAHSLRDLAAWIQEHRIDFNLHFKFHWGKTPKKSALSNCFAQLDNTAFEKAVLSCATPSKSGAIAADGKVSRGEGKAFFSIFDTQTLNALQRIPFEAGHEGQTLSDWLESGAASGRMVSADALHFQKKPLNPLKKEKPISSAL